MDCRTLTAEGRQGCRVISLDCSADFLDWLATKPKNYKFGFLYSYLYINGGKRSDSLTQYNTPALSPEASSMIHQWKGGEVMKTAFRAWGIPQAFATSTRLDITIYLVKQKSKLKLMSNYIASPANYILIITYADTLSPSPHLGTKIERTQGYGQDPRVVPKHHKTSSSRNNTTSCQEAPITLLYTRSNTHKVTRLHISNKCTGNQPQCNPNHHSGNQRLVLTGNTRRSNNNNNNNNDHSNPSNKLPTNPQCNLRNNKLKPKTNPNLLPPKHTCQFCLL